MMLQDGPPAGACGCLVQDADVDAEVARRASRACQGSPGDGRTASSFISPHDVSTGRLTSDSLLLPVCDTTRSTQASASLS